MSPPLPFLKKIRWIVHHMSFALHCALPKRRMMAMMKTPIWCGLWLKPGSWIQSLLLATTSIYTFIIQNRKLMYHIISYHIISYHIISYHIIRSFIPLFSTYSIHWIVSCKWGNLAIYTANTRLNSTSFFWVFLPARWRAMFQQSSLPLLEKWVPPGTRKPSYSNKRLGVRKGQEYSEHRWWKKSQTTTWDVQNLTNNGINNG